MSLDSLQDWRDAYEALPQVGDATWKDNLADFLGDLLDNLLNLTTYVSPGVPAYPAFTFDRATFAAGLTDVNGIVGMQTAFASAANTSSFSIPILTTYGAATPAETFSTPGLATIDPGSVTAGQAKIGELTTAPQVGDPQLSDFPVKLREAFLLLTYTVTGTNSVVPTPGPILDPARAVE